NPPRLPPSPMPTLVMKKPISGGASSFCAANPWPANARVAAAAEIAIKALLVFIRYVLFSNDGSVNDPAILCVSPARKEEPRLIADRSAGRRWPPAGGRG